MRRLVHVRGGYASCVYLFVYCGFMGDALFVIAIARYSSCFILPFERVSCSGCFNGALVFDVLHSLFVLHCHFPQFDLVCFICCCFGILNYVL